MRENIFKLLYRTHKGKLHLFILFFLITTTFFNNCSKFKSHNITIGSSQQSSLNGPHLLPNGAVTFFDLKSSQTQSEVFTLGTAFRQGDIPDVPAVTDPNIQIVVKKRWNDGSVKHAIFSGKSSLTKDQIKRVYIYSGASQPNTSSVLILDVNSIKAANPQASIKLSGIGSISLTSLLDKPSRIFIQGPEMIEAHYQSALSSTSPLIAWFQVRLYRDGAMWVRAIVENGIVSDTMTAANYIPEVVIGTSVVFNNGGSSLSHPAHTRWMAEGWINASSDNSGSLQIYQNTSYLIDTKLVPNYWKALTPQASFSGLVQKYTPLSNGNLTSNMGETGFQDQIGLLPKWDALFISSGSPSARDSVIANSSSLNSYPIIWRDQKTSKIPKPTDWPTWAIYGGTYEIPSGSLTWEVAHAPSEGYLSYMITGDYWHLETMAMQVATIYLSRSSTTGSGLNKLLLNQTRGTAWNLRTLSQYAAIAPNEDDGILTEYQTLLGHQIDYYQSVLHQPGVSPLGYLYEYDLSAYAPGVSAPWQQHFFIQTLGYGSDLQGLPDMTAWNEVRDWSYKAIVGILGDGVGGNFCYTKASSYNIKISSSANNDPTTWFKTWKDVMAASFPGSSTCGNTLEGDSGGDPSLASTGYWGNLLPAIAYAVDHKASGANEAFSRLLTSTNWSSLENSGFDSVPNWGIVPRTYSKQNLFSDPITDNSTPSPSPNPIETIPTPIIDNPGLGWSQVPNTKLASICAPDPSPGHSTSTDCRALVTAWGGAAIDSKRNRMILFGGGHGDYDGNELYAYDLSLKKILRLNDPTALPSGASGSGTYSDGRPASRHTYGGITYTDHNDKMTVFGGSIPYNGDLLRELWSLDFGSFYTSPNSATAWKKITNDIATGVNYGAMPFSTYDPYTKLVYLIDSGNGTYSFNTDTNEIKVLNDSSGFTDYHYTMIADPINHYVYAFGYNNVKRMSIATGSNYKWTDVLSSLGTSCSGLAGKESPGIAYDSKSKKIIGWNGGASVYVIDPITLSCSKVAFTGSTPGEQQAAGTFNRFAYFPTFDYFVLVNNADLDVYVLKMNK